MGLLDFIKDVGADIFGGNDEAEEITKLLNNDLPGKISNLGVEFADGTVTLSGEADSKASMEKAVLLAGNVKGDLSGLAKPGSPHPKIDERHDKIVLPYSVAQFPVELMSLSKGKGRLGIRTGSVFQGPRSERHPVRHRVHRLQILRRPRDAFARAEGLQKSLAVPDQRR